MDRAELVAMRGHLGVAERIRQASGWCSKACMLAHPVLSTKGEYKLAGARSDL